MTDQEKSFLCLVSACAAWTQRLRMVPASQADMSDALMLGVSYRPLRRK